MFIIGVVGAAIVTLVYKYTYLDNKLPRFRAPLGFLVGFTAEIITGPLVLPMPLMAELMLATMTGLAGVGLSFLIENTLQRHK